MEKEKIVAFEDAKFDDKTPEIYFDDVKLTYVQDPDCTEDQDGEVQTLYVETRNNGTSRFIAFSTDGKHFWSIDDIDDIVKLLNNFKEKAELK